MAQIIFRELVQLVERRSPKPDVVSSSLTFPAICNYPLNSGFREFRKELFSYFSIYCSFIRGLNSLMALVRFGCFIMKWIWGFEVFDIIT